MIVNEATMHQSLYKVDVSSNWHSYGLQQLDKTPIVLSAIIYI